MNKQMNGFGSISKAVGLSVALMLSTAVVTSAKYSGGSGTENDPYQVSSVADWEELAGSTEDWDKHFILTADIDFGGADVEQVAPDTSIDYGFQGIAFTGVFDGSWHVLRNGSINKPNTDYVGVFGKLRSGGEIRNLAVEGINVSGDARVGSMVGENNGTIIACYATGAVTSEVSVGGLVGCNVNGTITFCYATGAVSGEESVGGLVGYNLNSTITSCYATGDVTGDNIKVGGLVGNNEGTITSCHATGAVSGYDNVGGLVGDNYEGTITSCYATGNVSGIEKLGGLVGINNHSTITYCYATGDVIGNWTVGGLVGWNREDGTITSCYWDMDASGITESDGGEGRTTEQMTYPYSDDTYVDWDFEETWVADIDGSNGGYPFFANLLDFQPSLSILSISVIEDTCYLKWPVTATNWVPQESESLLPDSWKNIPTESVFLYEESYVLPLPLESRQFFRLKKAN